MLMSMQQTMEMGDEVGPGGALNANSLHCTALHCVSTIHSTVRTRAAQTAALCLPAAATRSWVISSSSSCLLPSSSSANIPENCAWLYGHDVHLLTFTQRSPVQPFEQHYYAAVLRKSISPPQILLQEQHPLSTDGATTKLLATVEAKIGVLLQQENTTAVVPEQTKRFFEALLAKAPVKAVNPENLTEHNLSLLDVRASRTYTHTHTHGPTNVNSSAAI